MGTINLDRHSPKETKKLAFMFIREANVEETKRVMSKKDEVVFEFD